jgi:hypothetical protein
MPHHPTSRTSVLILSSHLQLGLPSDRFPSGFPTKTPYAPLLSPTRATCPSYLILLDLITLISGEECRSLSSSLCSLLHSYVRSKYPPQHPILENSLPAFQSLHTARGTAYSLNAVWPKFLSNSHLPRSRYMSHPSHRPCLDQPNICWRWNSLILPIFFHIPFTCCLLPTTNTLNSQWPSRSFSTPSLKYNRTDTVHVT